jgi:PDZ domain-containing protein
VKRLLVLAVVLAAATVALFVFPSDHYLFLPDPARPVDPLIRIQGEDAAAEEGGVYMVDILVRRASLFERLFPGVEEGASLAPEEDVNPAGVSEGQRRKESLNEMSRSQEIAVTVALRELGHEVEVEEKGVEVASVLPDRPAAGKLEIGDVIVEARGRPVKTRDELLELMGAVRPGQVVELVVVREDERRTVRVGTVADDEDENRAVFGVIVQQAAEFDFPLRVRIDAGDIGGPSAGLAFALQIVDELGPELDAGRRIAVTGELDLDGDVGPIGGIKQKTIGAREAGAAIFIVPDENAQEARRYAENLEIVAVSTFDEALTNLTTR